MNPCRLHALFDAYFKTKRKQSNERFSTGAKKTTVVDLDEEAGTGKSLVNYFRGG